MLKAFKERHDVITDQLNQLDGVDCLPSDGTFYLFPNMQAIINRLEGIEDDVALGEFFIEKAGVALVPGSAFGCPGHVRISIATSMENLTKAMERIKMALA